MNLPQYTRKDLLIMAVNLPFITLFLIYMLYGRQTFTDWKVLLFPGLTLLVLFIPVWYLFAWIAVTVRKRFPANSDLLKRMCVTILVIATIQALEVTLVFYAFDYFNILGYEFNEKRYTWTLGAFLCINIIITMIHEGFSSFERWKTTLTETEMLKKAYTQSQLLGLKSQVNPHFLFNSLNSLSSLIAENEEKAEKFLNELTRVYRYMLKGSDEKIVALQTELQFISSYFHLLKTRYGEGVELSVDVDEKFNGKGVTPLLLQTFIEYSFNTNTLSRKEPLQIAISVENEKWLTVRNTLHLKKTADLVSTDGIYNLMDKYKLLGEEEIKLSRENGVFIMRVPLLEEKMIAEQ